MSAGRLFQTELEALIKAEILLGPPYGPPPLLAQIAGWALLVLPFLMSWL